MVTYKREQLDKLVKEIQKDNLSQVYLLFGERYLCRQAAEKISQALLAGGGNIHSIDGSQENLSVTIGKITSFSLFPGRQIYRVNDTRIFHSAKNAQALWKKAAAANNENNPQLAAKYLRSMLNAVGLNADDADNDPGSLAAARWKKLFGFAKPQEKLDWTEKLLNSSGNQADSGEKATSAFDPTQLFAEAIVAGLPKQNFLILITEDVDKRKKLFKLLNDQFVTVDLSVDTGSSSQAQKSQNSVLQEVLSQILAKYQKTISPDITNLLFERVGFHPVALALEAEKLALHAGPREQIKRSDIDSLIGRTRQEALFELTDALGKKELERSLITAERLQQNGIHPLAIIATIRNHLRTLILFKALQEMPENSYTASMSPALFQQQCLPRLKNNEQWKKELSGHPYAVYMKFKTASAFSLSTLKQWMSHVLQADFRLKGSHIAPETIIQHLIIKMIANSSNPVLKKYP